MPQLDSRWPGDRRQLTLKDNGGSSQAPATCQTPRCLPCLPKATQREMREEKRKRGFIPRATKVHSRTCVKNEAGRRWDSRLRLAGPFRRLGFPAVPCPSDRRTARRGPQRPPWGGRG